MELNQQLHALLNNQLSGRAGGDKTLSARMLSQLTQVVNAETAKTLLAVLQQHATNTPSPVRTAPAQLPAVPVQVSVQGAGTTVSQQQQQPQLTLQLNVGGRWMAIEVPVTRAQQQQIQQLQQQTPNLPLVLIAKAVTTTSTRGGGGQAQLNVQWVNPQQPKTPVDLTLPLNQLSKPLAQALVNSVTRSAAPATVTTPATAVPTPSADLSGTGTLVKQANQITPQQLRQALQSLLPTAATPSTPLVATASPEQAINHVLRAVMTQLPSGESMQQPQQLKQWVNDWFAAKPVAAAPQQQMGGLGKMLMMLLGMALQKPSSGTSQSPPLSGAQQQTVSQVTQALLDQILRPAPRAAGEANFSGDVRERINQLLQQLPQAQLQRLMQLFTAAVNSAQTSQSRLADSAAATPEYYVLLPASAEQQGQQHELLLRREHERSAAHEEGRTVWLFTLRFELKHYGPLLVKGRYHPAGTRVDFYTESDRAQTAMADKLEKLQARFDALKVSGLNLTVQKGRVPDTLAKQQSGIIRVTV